MRTSAPQASIFLPDLTELHYATNLRETEGAAELRFNRLNLSISHLGSNLFHALTSVGSGFFIALLVLAGIFVFLYCRCQPPASTYLAGQVIIQQPLAAPSSPSGSHSLPLIYQAPSSAGHTYQYINTRRLCRKQGHSQACCGGTHSSDEDAGAYMANTDELAYLNDLSKIKYWVPKDLAYAADRVGQSKGAYT